MDQQCFRSMIAGHLLVSCCISADTGEHQTHLKLPSTPDTSMALIIILVSLNGTCTNTHMSSSPPRCTAGQYMDARQDDYNMQDTSSCATSTPAVHLVMYHSSTHRKRLAFSGNFSRCMDASKQSPKSMCRSLPLYLSSMRLLGCLSPKPSKYPTYINSKIFIAIVTLCMYTWGPQKRRHVGFSMARRDITTWQGSESLSAEAEGKPWT